MLQINDGGCGAGIRKIPHCLLSAPWWKWDNWVSGYKLPTEDGDKDRPLRAGGAVGHQSQ